MARTRVALVALAVAVAGLVATGLATLYWLKAAEEAARALGRGVNLGNMLEAPREGEWGLTLAPELFDRVKEAGFHTVRLPVRWSNHAQPGAPYQIDEAFFARVDFAIDQALTRNLRVVVNMHHHRQLDGDPLDPNEKRVDDAVLEERFLAMWRQIATRYRRIGPDKLYFELYNEPHGRLDAQAWNGLLARGLEVVRAITPRRFVVIGPVNYNKIDALHTLELPWRDRRIIVTVHVYDPYEFTHQGAPWVPGSRAWLGTTCCNEAQRREISARLETAQSWSVQHARPIWVGEFGSYEKADEASRVRYTRFAREAIEAHGFTWAYWELASSFGLLDPTTQTWRVELKHALLGTLQ